MFFLSNIVKNTSCSGLHYILGEFTRILQQHFPSSHDIYLTWNCFMPFSSNNNCQIKAWNIARLDQTNPVQFIFPYYYFSKHRPSGPMLSISRFVYMCVCLSVCSLLRYRLNVFLLPLPKVGCPKKLCWFCLTKHGGNHASRWIRDLWSKGISLILAYL